MNGEKDPHTREPRPKSKLMSSLTHYQEGKEPLHQDDAGDLESVVGLVQDLFQYGRGVPESGLVEAWRMLRKGSQHWSPMHLHPPAEYY